MKTPLYFRLNAALVQVLIPPALVETPHPNQDSDEAIYGSVFIPPDPRYQLSGRQTLDLDKVQ